MLLAGTRALVTGAHGRLGSRIVAVLAREGASVAALDLDPPAEGRAGPSAACVVAADVSDPVSVDAGVDQAERVIGPLDLLVNAHGIFPNRLVAEVDVAEWDRVFAVNVRGTMLTCQALARRWVTRDTRGVIVNISSGAATSARAGGAHYCGSKAAVNMLTHVLAIELGPHGIRVNAVAPGLILDDVVNAPGQATDPVVGHGDGETLDPPYVRATLAMTPLRRTGSPDEVAEAVAFLASDRSAWTTGAILEVTGGSHCGRTHLPTSGGLR